MGCGAESSRRAGSTFAFPVNDFGFGQLNPAFEKFGGDFSRGIQSGGFETERAKKVATDEFENTVEVPAVCAMKPIAERSAKP